MSGGLEPQEPDLRRLVASLPHLLFTCTPDGECDYLSPQWVEYTGKPAEKQLRYGWLEQVHPADTDAVWALWKRSTAQGVPFDSELRVRRSDGVYRWFKTRVLPTLDDAGRVVKWYGTSTDIQALRDAEDAVARANRELEATVEARTSELRAAKRRIETTAVQLETAQRLAHVASWTFDVEADRVEWSPELFRIFGLTPEANPPPFEEQHRLYDALSWERLSQAVTRALATGEGYDLELVALRTDGVRRTVHVRGEAVLGPTGNVEQLVGMLQDVTSRDEAAQEIRLLSERLQLATSAAKIGVWTWDIRTNGLAWDRHMRLLYEVPLDLDPLDYDCWKRALHPDDAERAERELLAAVEGGSAFDTTFRIVPPSGRVKHIRAAAAFERDADGRPLHMTGVNWDISELRTTEASLRSTETLQRAILEYAGIAIIATNCEGIITLFNPAAEALLGYSAEELVGKATPLVIHLESEVLARRRAEGDPNPTVSFHVGEAKRTGRDVSECTYVCKDGRHVPVLLTVTQLLDAAGTTVGYLGVAVNLTERKAQERDLVELNRLLRERSRQMDVLLQEVHHRVKNNLQIIASLVNMQARQTVGPSHGALIECRNRVQAIALIHEQLYNSKNYADVPFSTYVHQLARNIQSAAGSTAENVTFTFALEPIALSVDIAIPCGLLLNELLTNALKHGFEDGRAGTVRVELRTMEGAAVLSVHDDGKGLPEAFEPRSQRTLGMQLVLQLARQLRGDVEALSTTAPARGTEFRVTFPWIMTPTLETA